MPWLETKQCECEQEPWSMSSWVFKTLVASTEHRLPLSTQAELILITYTIKASWQNECGNMDSGSVECNTGKEATFLFAALCTGHFGFIMMLQYIVSML